MYSLNIYLFYFNFNYFIQVHNQFIEFGSRDENMLLLTELNYFNQIVQEASITEFRIL